MAIALIAGFATIVVFAGAYVFMGKINVDFQHGGEEELVLEKHVGERNASFADSEPYRRAS